MRYGFLKPLRYDPVTGNPGYRLRTVKLRGALSQGLALPLEDFPEVLAVLEEAGDTDFAELLGVTKWEPPVPAQLSGIARGNFPSFIRKTDQERVQNIPRLTFERHDNYEITQKLDGSSMTVYLNNGVFGVCSRNLDLVEDESNTFWKVALRYNFLEALLALGRNIALQGELIGEGIQGNPERLIGQDFYLFDIWLIDEQRYASQYERNQIMQRIPGLKHVPIIDPATCIYGTDVDAVLKFAERKSAINTVADAEGLVFKMIDGSSSWKAISNRYLLQEIA